MRRIRNALAAYVITLVLLRSSQVFSSQPEYPFSDVINWEDESQRKEFEKHLTLAGFSSRSLRVEHPPTDKRWAKSTEFLLWEKGRTLAGFGAVFQDLILPGTAVGPEGDEVTFKLNRAEILYDVSGRRIFLVTYRTEMSLIYKILWFFLPENKKKEYIRKYKMEASRSIFTWGELGEGHQLNRRSEDYARFLLDAPAIFKTIFDKEKPLPAAALQVPFDQELFRKLSP